MKRFIGWMVLATVALPGGAWAQFRSTEVTLDYVAEKAEARAHKPFHSPKGDLPDIL